MSTTRPAIPSAHERRRVAVEAAVDPRTLERFLRGESIRSTCAARIVEALQRLKIEPAVWIEP